MINSHIKTPILVLFCALLFLSGCHSFGIHHSHHKDRHYHSGPPPHAPAHGYRHKHGGHDLQFDSDLGVYVVLGLHNHYFIDGMYYRFSSDGWYFSTGLDRGWKMYEKDSLPGKLYKKHAYKKHGDKKKNKSHKGKKRKRHDD